MIGGLIIFLLGAIFCFSLIKRLKRKFPFIDARMLRMLFGYHFFLTLVYFIYILFYPSDSQYYFLKVANNLRGDTWSDYYGTSTIFIEFVAYPFIKYAGFSYEAIMVLFSTVGYIGFIYFYIFFKENIRFNHYLWGYNLLTITFFLPNLHFWSSSFGKGAIIFLGIALFFFGISKIRSRLPAIIIGGLIVYHVRPHIMLVILVSSALGFIFSTRGVGMVWRVVFLIGATVAFFYIYEDALKLVGIDEEEFITQGLDLSNRANELTKAGSGVNITSYSLPMQVFTFLFRPLFFDAPGVLGIIVSFENVFYLIMTFMVLRDLGSIKFLLAGNMLIKSAFFSFLTVSIALAQISGNLGLAMRQKSQVMILFLFVTLSFLDDKKFQAWQFFKIREKRKERLRKALELRLGSSQS